MTHLHRILFLFIVNSALSIINSFAQQSLTILHTGDTHSCVEPISINDLHPDQAGKAGYLRRAALVDSLRRQTPDLLLLDCGDFSQGSVYYTLYKGEVEIRLMNLMRYDACTIGNHEFDNGMENMARIFRMAAFPIVCCNYDFTGTPVEGLVKPYTIVERAGHRIGILGVSPRLEGLVAKATCEGTTYTDPALAAQPIIDHLRQKEQCDVVICLSHLGYDKGPAPLDPDFIRQTRGIDVVLGGHSHTYMKQPLFLPNADGLPVLLDHQGKNGRFVGCTKLEWQ